VAAQIAEPIAQRLARSLEPARDRQILVTPPRPYRTRALLAGERQRRGGDGGAAAGKKRAT
jgi:hypothetical protein